MTTGKWDEGICTSSQTTVSCDSAAALRALLFLLLLSVQSCADVALNVPSSPGLGIVDSQDERKRRSSRAPAGRRQRSPIWCLFLLPGRSAHRCLIPIVPASFVLAFLLPHLNLPLFSFQGPLDPVAVREVSFIRMYLTRLTSPPSCPFCPPATSAVRRSIAKAWCESCSCQDMGATV